MKKYYFFRKKVFVFQINKNYELNKVLFDLKNYLNLMKNKIFIRLFIIIFIIKKIYI